MLYLSLVGYKNTVINGERFSIRSQFEDVEVGLLETAGLGSAGRQRLQAEGSPRQVAPPGSGVVVPVPGVVEVLLDPGIPGGAALEVRREIERVQAAVDGGTSQPPVELPQLAPAGVLCRERSRAYKPRLLQADLAATSAVVIYPSTY